MRFKKSFYVGVAFCALLALAGCGKKHETDETPNVNPDKYGCVMFSGMENGSEDSLCALSLTPDGAFKSFVPYGSETGKWSFPGKK